MGLFDRLKHGWNAFMGRDPTFTRGLGYGNSYKPDRPKLQTRNERSIINAIYTRISVDVAAITIEHAKLDENGRYQEPINSGLNSCLTLSANIDQTHRAFIQDIVFSMLDEGDVAVVPTDATFNPTISASYDIQSMRVGKILEWYPQHIKVRLYNEKTGNKEDLVFPKKICAIITNPFYAIMNERNSTAQRLIRKLYLLDAVDEQSSSGKLDLIIQLPYTIKGKTRQEQAEKRRADLEMQLSGSKYGIGYIDGTERITQLNRSVENNLLKQIEYLTSMLYSQLGMPPSVFDGTADEATMLNYQNRTLEPIISAITDEMKRKFLTNNARTRQQSIVFFKDPFRLVPVGQMADIADKFTRNEILSSNEVRQIVGFKPSKDPKADELRNKNLNEKEGAEPSASVPTEENEEQVE